MTATNTEEGKNWYPFQLYEEEVLNQTSIISDILYEMSAKPTGHVRDSNIMREQQNLSLKISKLDRHLRTSGLSDTVKRKLAEERQALMKKWKLLDKKVKIFDNIDKLRQKRNEAINKLNQQEEFLHSKLRNLIRTKANLPHDSVERKKMEQQIQTIKNQIKQVRRKSTEVADKAREYLEKYDKALDQIDEELKRIRH